MNYFKSVPLFCELHPPALQFRPSLRSLLWFPSVFRYFYGRRNSMIPHPAAITPGWQDPIGRLPYHVISVSGHDAPNTTLCQKVKKKIATKIVTPVHSSWGIITATLGARLVSYFRIHATCHTLATISNLPCLQACTSAHILWPSVSL